jgi:sec-independent protein translocase protein TatA
VIAGRISESRRSRSRNRRDPVVDLVSISHWLVVLGIVLVLFGAGKLPTVMGDLAKGIKAFKTGISDTPPPEQ